MDFCYFSSLEIETQLCEDFGNLANHGFSPPPNSFISFYESSVFLFASVSDRMSTVCPEKRDLFYIPVFTVSKNVNESYILAEVFKQSKFS